MVQLVTSKDRQPIQHPITTSMPTTIQVATSLLTYVPRLFDHQPLDGGQPKDSPKRSSFGGNLPRGPPFNRLVASFGWPALDLHLFIPP
jgi:hypothetical protein